MFLRICLRGVEHDGGRAQQRVESFRIPVFDFVCADCAWPNAQHHGLQSKERPGWNIGHYYRRELRNDYNAIGVD
jgi:hypothetical protein